MLFVSNFLLEEVISLIQIAIFRAQTCRENYTPVSVKNRQLMDVTCINPVRFCSSGLRNAHTSSFVGSAGTVPVTARRGFIHVTVSDGTWLFSMSSCVYENSLLDYAETFSSVVVFWGWRTTQGIAIPDYILWWKKLVQYFYEIVPEIVFLSSVGSCVTKGYGQIYFSSFLIGTFWSLLSSIRRYYTRATILFFRNWTELIEIWAGILKW